MPYHNDEFEFVAGVSCGIIYKQKKREVYYKKAKELLELARFHGNQHSGAVLERLEFIKDSLN